MTFSEAIKTGLPLTRENKTWSYINDMTYGARTVGYVMPNTFIAQDFFLSQFKLTREDVLANDWIVQGFGAFDYETVE